MPKKTKRKYLMEGLIINIFIFIIFIVLISFYIYPQVVAYEKQKKELFENYENLQKIQKEGISYDEFITISEKTKIQDTYLQNLIKILPKEFYQENIKNTAKDWEKLEESYDVFIDKKKSFITQKTKEWLYHQEKDTIKNILPEYAWNMIIKEEWVLTDFAFINSIEQLFYNFNLEVNKKIGVENLVEISDQETQEKTDSLDTKIYYIPFSTRLVGKKSSLLNFLLFAENIGTIEIQDWKVQSNKGKNNYTNQIFDIERITFKDYIDTSLMWTQRWEQANFSKDELIAFLKKEQGDEKIEVDIVLRFFVRWMPEYQVKEFINTTLEKYVEVKKRAQKILAQISILEPKNSEEILIINKIKSINFDLKSLEEDIKKMKASLAKSQKLGDAYQSAVQLNTIFNLFWESFDVAETIIEKLNNK